jgi:uncharacterized phage protein gp47/JayE
MLLPLNGFSTLVQQMSAAVQGGAQQLIDLSVGSVLRALLEASASVALWMQWLILQVLSITRAATSNGADLDSWMADYSLVRLPGASANGIVTFARYTIGLGTFIPVGTVVRTVDGSQSFTVVASASSVVVNGVTGYSLPAQLASVDVAVQAVVAGSAGNVLAGAIGLLNSAIPGVDTVNNAAACAGGVDPESDASFRLRFQAYINSRSLATALALTNAILAVQQGLRYSIVENQDSSGNAMPGHFVVAVDDGTGYPPTALLSEVQQAVEQVRPLGSTYAVTPPVVIPATVQMSLETSNPLTKPAVASAVQQSVASWIAGLPMGGTLAISKIDALAHGADPSVVSVMGTTINGSAMDVSAPVNGVIIAGSVTVS